MKKGNQLHLVTMNLFCTIRKVSAKQDEFEKNKINILFSISFERKNIDVLFLFYIVFERKWTTNICANKLMAKTRLYE